MHNTNCELNNGELIAIVGSNGAGKSTMMRCISGEYRPASGSVVWKGKDISQYRITDMAKERAMLTQANNTNTGFNVSQVVMLGRYPHYDYYPAKSDNEIVESSISSQGLDRFKERSYSTTLRSCGQQRTLGKRQIAVAR